MSQTAETYIDVVELCGILQCLGFHVKSIDTKFDKNSSREGPRTVIVDCQTSGLHVVLENGSPSCSCPTMASPQNSGVWQVSGITGGKHLDKEFGSSVLGSLPKSHRERLTKQLQDIVCFVKEHNGAEGDKKDGLNRSASMIEMNTPDKRHLEQKAETPTRYRSLDTLTGNKAGPEPLPAPGALLKKTDDNANKVQAMCARQSTYTLSSTPDNSRRRNKTSSPIQASRSSVLDNLMAAQLYLNSAIKEMMDNGRYDSCSSLADVSKISLVKTPDKAKSPFLSSPNLSGVGKKEDSTQTLKGIGSASTSNLATKESRMSKLRRISPNLLRNSLKNDKEKQASENSKNSKLSSLFKPKIVTPVRGGTPNNSQASSNLSGSKKKYSHVKSTIPRPSPSASKK